MLFVQLIRAYVLDRPGKEENIRQEIQALINKTRKIIDAN